jgi:hypothetical protein
VEVIIDDSATGPRQSRGFLLRETAGMKGKYVALSHRWGDDTFATRTTKSNYERRLSECHWPSPMALDAALHALSLGVRYIWIDSWCIVQDDAADWARESVRMADYYQHAWLTISATTLSAQGGLVSTVPPEHMPRLVRLPYRDKEGRQQGYFYAQCWGEGKLARDYVRHVSRSPLLRRGWVYQEWMLSRRLLTFSAADVFVQCRRAAPKALVGGEVRRAALGDKKIGAEPEASNDLAFKSALEFDLSSIPSVLESWFKVVKTYSGLELTRLEEDRLIALSGVAKEFGLALAEREKEAAAGRGGSPSCQHHYVCGTWFSYPTGLLWEQAGGGGRKARAQGLPTWSWASMATLMDNDKGGEVLTGMAVQWAAPTSLRFQPAIVCHMLQARRVPVEVSVDGDGRTIMTPLYGQATEEPQEEEYNHEHRFAMLGMKGKLMRVRVHGEFESEGEVATAATLTGHEPDFGRDMWRKTTTESERDVLIGWASIEHPDWQSFGGQSNETTQADGSDPRSTGEGTVVYAFFITRIAQASGGLGYGNWMGRQAVFKVLFLRPVEIPGFGGCYERLGTGRLFGNDVDAAFQELQDAEGLIWLV